MSFSLTKTNHFWVPPLKETPIWPKSITVQPGTIGFPHLNQSGSFPNNRLCGDGVRRPGSAGSRRCVNAGWIRAGWIYGEWIRELKIHGGSTTTLLGILTLRIEHHHTSSVFKLFMFMLWQSVWCHNGGTNSIHIGVSHLPGTSQIL